MNITTKPHLHQDWIDHHALGIVRALQKAGHTTYLVGGCVRDLLIGIIPKDYDIATSALPQEVQKIIHRSYIIGRRFRLVLVKRQDQQFEVATFRREVREDEIPEEGLVGDNAFGSPEEDARRRDFTVNGLFYDPVSDELIDYAEGLPDLEHRLVRMIGDPDRRLLEDPIRIMRGLRLKHMVNFSLEPELRRAMTAHAGSLATTALPRRREEILKWLKLPDPSLPLLESYDLQILQAISPTIAKALDKGEGSEEFFSLLRKCHEQMFDKPNPVELFGGLVHAFVRAFLHQDPLEPHSTKELMDHPVITPWMKDELGMFKTEQTLVMKALHMQPLLGKRDEFERRGERRKQALLRNDAFTLALAWGERDLALPAEDLVFWRDQWEIEMARDPGEVPPRPPKRRRPPRRRK